MSESNRRVCGEGLSLTLQDRDIRVVGKSLSESKYASVRIGSVGQRIEQRMKKAERAYQHFLPKSISRFFGSSKMSLWNNSYASPELQYLLWSPFDEDIEEEIEEAPTSAWMKTKKPWVGARVFRMPKSVRNPIQRSRNAKPTSNRSVRPLQRLRAKNMAHDVRNSASTKALESLPPFLAASKKVQKIVRQAQRHDVPSNPYQSQSIATQFFSKNLQPTLTPSKSGSQQAQGRMRAQKPTGLRPLHISSPMMQELVPAFSDSVEDNIVEEQKESPWFTRPSTQSPVQRSVSSSQVSSSQVSSSQVSSSQVSSSAGSEQRDPFPRAAANDTPTLSKNRSVLSSLGRSFRRAVQQQSRPSQRVAQNINLGLKPKIQETPASVHALQRSAWVSESNTRSVLPIANVFSEQGQIGKRIARHQESMFPQRDSKLGATTSQKVASSLPKAHKRSQVRRPQLFSIPDLLDLQSQSQSQPIESVQQQSVSPWFTRQPQRAAKQHVITKKQQGQPKLAPQPTENVWASRTAIPSTESTTRSIDGFTSRAVRPPESEVTSEQLSRQQPTASEIADVDIFGFDDKPARPSRYAEQRMVKEEGLLPKTTPQSRESSYQPLDQKFQDRLDARWEEGKNQMQRMTEALPHQVRERRFVSAPDFVPIQHQADDIESDQEEVAVQKSPWFTRSPIVHAANRKEGRSSEGSLLPKVAIPKEKIAARSSVAPRSFSEHSQNPIQSALDRSPKPSALNPSRPQIVRNTQEPEAEILRSSGLDQSGRSLAKAVAQTPQRVSRSTDNQSGWAEVRFRRQAPISYARQSAPQQVVVQSEMEREDQIMSEEGVSPSPWFTREPQKSTNASASVSTGQSTPAVERNLSEAQIQAMVDQITHLPKQRQAKALSHMIARSNIDISLPEEITVGTKSRSLFSGQPTVRLSTLPPQMQLASLKEEEGIASEVPEVASKPSPWLSPKEASVETRAANALIKRVAKLGVKAKVYRSPKGTMMDAKAARALGFSPPKGKSRIPLTWVLEAVENKSNSGVLPNWAQRASEDPLHKGTTALITSINRASSMDEIIKVIFERTGSKQIAPSFQNMPIAATKVLQNIRQEAQHLQLVQEEQKEQIAQVQAKEKGLARAAKNIVSNFTGLKPLATAPVAAAGVNDDKLSKLTRKLEDLILVAEQEGKREAQGGARLAEDSAQAIEEGRSEPKGIDEGVSEQLNLDQLYRDVLRAVEDAINLKRVLRFDNDDHFDGGW